MVTQETVKDGAAAEASAELVPCLVKYQHYPKVEVLPRRLLTLLFWKEL